MMPVPRPVRIVRSMRRCRLFVRPDVVDRGIGGDVESGRLHDGIDALPGVGSQCRRIGYGLQIAVLADEGEFGGECIIVVRGEH